MFCKNRFYFLKYYFRFENHIVLVFVFVNDGQNIFVSVIVTVPEILLLAISDLTAYFECLLSVER